MSKTKNVNELFQLIKEAKYLTALTGAGVSTLSGIRDFRGKNGLYNETDEKLKQQTDKMFDINYFEKDPSLYYNAAGSFIYNLDEKEASIVHITLGELEKQGFLKALVTQNIDLLHQKGGCKNVIEVHGSPKTHYCLRCAGVNVTYEEAATAVHKGEMPLCPKCGRVLKPAITFFGESLPEKALRQAVTEAQQSDLMLVLGTSLTVYPAASIPEYVLRNSGKIVIVNDMPTPLDTYAYLRFDDLGSVFEELNEYLRADDTQ